MKTFKPSSKKNIYYLIYDVFNWVTPRQSTTNCLQLQLFRIFIMMQPNCSRLMCIIITYLDGLVKRDCFAFVLSEHVRLKDNIGRICFYPTVRYFQLTSVK